ncbi:MAG: hypothetical protein K8R36_22550 [Planctomycetales bacterium]|nr:hypothetical protein [Planctomycetales bacterium]
MPTTFSRRAFGLGSLALASSAILPALVGAQQPGTTPAQPKKRLLIPGTGLRIAKTGDDFEDTKFEYYPQHPKSSWNINKQMNVPGGISLNNLWAEGGKRGTPDVVKRIATPPGGIEGSKGCMMIQSLNPGIPGRASGEEQQDDLLHNVEGVAGTQIPVAWSPNVVCRVYIPSESQWEKRNGATFGYRIGLYGYTPQGKYDEYWPGIFFHMQREQTADGKIKPSILSVLRADEFGRDLPGPVFQPSSWCTLGMSMPPDGSVQFFGKPGIEDLTEKDYLGGWHCYSWRAVNFSTFFYNVINMDNGRTWGTPWTIDNSYLYVATAPRQNIKNAERTAAKPKELVPPQPPK